MKNDKKLQEWCEIVVALNNSKRLSDLNLDMSIFDAMIFTAAVELGLNLLGGNTIESLEAFSESINRKGLTVNHVKEAADWYLIQGNTEPEGMEREPQDKEGGEYSDWIQDNEKESF